MKFLLVVALIIFFIAMMIAGIGTFIEQWNSVYKKQDKLWVIVVAIFDVGVFILVIGLTILLLSPLFK